MADITIFGRGNMGQAIGGLMTQGGNQVTKLGHSDAVPTLGSIVVLAVPYDAALAIAKANKSELKGKVVVDVTNPVNFETWDGLVVPADSSATEQLANLLPDSQVIKAFNTNFSNTLVTKKVSETVPTKILTAGDSLEAKQALKESLEGSQVEVIDAGNLNRARELEAFGFLQMSLATNKKITGLGVLD